MKRWLFAFAFTEVAQMLVNVNVHVSVYSLKSPLSSADLQFTPLVLELFLMQSHLLWGEFSICALCCSYSQSLQLSFLVPPGTHHSWVDRGGVIWEACPWLVMCYHCVRIAVGSHRHPCSTRRQVQLCPLPQRHIRCHFLCCGEPNAWLLRDSQVV